MRWIDFENKKPTDAFEGWEPWSQEDWQAWLDKSERLLKQMEAFNSEVTQLKADGDDEGAEEKLKARNKVIDDNSSHWGELKEWLLALSHRKCWFSEVKDLYNHWHVEHFRPKKQAKDDKNCDSDEKAVTRDGYWWLAFDYSNYRICGSVGNTKKGGWFPLKQGSICSKYDSRCEESESPYLIDPSIASDVSLLAFDEEGKIIAAPGASTWETERVEISVKRLKLDQHEALTEARRDIWQTVSREIEGFRTAKQRAAQGCNPAAKTKLEGHIRTIRDMVKPSAQLSSVARWCVSFRNEPQLTQLVN